MNALKLGRMTLAYCMSCFAVSTSVMAHHSTSMFDSGQCRTVQGTVRNMEWTYPHIWLWLVAPKASGATEIWGFEGLSPNEMNRTWRWTKGTIKPGDKITVRANPLKDGRRAGSLNDVILSDGRAFLNAAPFLPSACKTQASGGVAFTGAAGSPSTFHSAAKIRAEK